MIRLSGFQQELLNFLQSHMEEGHLPNLREVAMRFGFSEDAIRHHVCDLQKRGLFQSEKSVFPRLATRWRNAPRATNIPVFGTIPGGAPNDSTQELIAFLPVSLDQIGIAPSEDLFALKVSGNSMIGKQIADGDYVVLNSSKTPRNGNVVAALVDGQTTLKTYVEKNQKKFLRAENPAYPDIFPAKELRIQGVMVFTVPKAKLLS